MKTMIHRNPTGSDTNSGSTLSSAQARVVAALAQGLSITEAARKAGVHRDTTYRWLQNQPEFETAVENARAEYVGVLANGLRDLAARALESLQELLDDRKCHRRSARVRSR
jgi:transposase-like protein